MNIKRNIIFTLESRKKDGILIVENVPYPYACQFSFQTNKMVERDIERQLVSHITKYLWEMGSDYAFVAQQKYFEVGESDLNADLILYNIQLQAYVVIELKATSFKSEYKRQLNLYICIRRHPLWRERQ